MIVSKDGTPGENRLIVHRFHAPAAMSIIPHWVLWRKETLKDRVTKIPYSPMKFVDGYPAHASSTDPETWTTFENAVRIGKQYHDFNGVGFVFTDDIDLTFIDIDHCVDESGNMSAIAEDIYKTIGDRAYWELSQSGTGIHCFANGNIPRCFKNSRNGVEMYDHARYVAFTGHELTSGAVLCDEMHVDTLSLLNVWNRYKTPDRPHREAQTGREAVSSLTDREVISKCMNSANGELFRRLYDGDFTGLYKSHSEADLVLCGLLAFWTDRDPGAIDRIFRTSGLMREKWNRVDYRSRTIGLAVDGCSESLREFVERKAREERLKYAKCFLQE